MKERLDKIKHLIGDGDLKEALRRFTDFAEETSLASYQSILILQSEYNDISKRYYELAIISASYYDRKKNRIRIALLQFYNEARNNFKSKKALENNENTILEIAEEIDSQKEMGTIEFIMDPIQQLVRSFLSLPEPIKWKIAENLDLYSEEDEDLESKEQYKRLFIRAKEAEKLAEMWEEVMEAADIPMTENPFKNQIK